MPPLPALERVEARVPGLQEGYIFMCDAGMVDRKGFMRQPYRRVISVDRRITEMRKRCNMNAASVSRLSGCAEPLSEGSEGRQRRKCEAWNRGNPRADVPVGAGERSAPERRGCRMLRRKRGGKLLRVAVSAGQPLEPEIGRAQTAKISTRLLLVELQKADVFR
jgi:hypothetical protein